MTIGQHQPTMAQGMIFAPVVACAVMERCSFGDGFPRGEEADLSGQGFELFDRDGELNFRMPCTMLCDGLCSIYSSRPKTCRDFRCKLLKRHRLGELQAGEGQSRVEMAKQLKEAVVSRDPTGAYDGPRQILWHELATELKSAPLPEREDLAGRLLAVASLETYLRQWFRDDSAADGARIPVRLGNE